MLMGMSKALFWFLFVCCLVQTHSFLTLSLHGISGRNVVYQRCQQLRQLPCGNKSTFSVPRCSKISLDMMFWGAHPPPKDEDEGKGRFYPPPLDIEADEDLETTLYRGKVVGKLVVLNWYASWCRKCAYLEPRFKKISRDNMETAIFAKVDAISLEYNKGKSGPSWLKKWCGITKYPTFQVWKDETLVAERVGDESEGRIVEKDLRCMIDEWATKKAVPLRLTGVGATKEEYRLQGSKSDDRGDMYQQGGSSNQREIQ